MANNYLQFSESLEIPSAEAEVWIRSQLDTSGLGDNPPQTYEWQRDESSLEEESNGFSWMVEVDPEGNRSLWIYADEWGNPGDVASFVQAFLRRFSPLDVWTLTYSTTCSKPRVGEFSGGAIVVTADAIESFDAGDWAADTASRKQRQ